MASHCLWTKNPRVCPGATKACMIWPLISLNLPSHSPPCLAYSLPTRHTSCGSPSTPNNLHVQSPLPGMLLSPHVAPRLPYSFDLSLNAISSKRPSLTIVSVYLSPHYLHRHAFPSLHSFYSPISLWPFFLIGIMVFKCLFLYTALFFIWYPDQNTLCDGKGHLNLHTNIL